MFRAILVQPKKFANGGRHQVWVSEVTQYMPIYEYECTACGKIEEVLQKISEKPMTKCHHCSGKLHKLMSQSTFHLKGTGWYATDYATKSASSAKTSEKTKENKSTQEKTSDSGSKSKEKSTKT